MEFTTFVRKPFVVEAVEVTEENIAEIAPLVGTLSQKEDGTPFIAVNRKLVPNVFRVYPGFWMTRMGDNIHCYTKKLFASQFIEQDQDIKAWVDFLNADNAPGGTVEEPLSEAEIAAADPDGERWNRNDIVIESPALIGEPDGYVE